MVVLKDSWIASKDITALPRFRVAHQQHRVGQRFKDLVTVPDLGIFVQRTRVVIRDGGVYSEQHEQENKAENDRFCEGRLDIGIIKQE